MVISNGFLTKKIAVYLVLLLFTFLFLIFLSLTTKKVNDSWVSINESIISQELLK